MNIMLAASTNSFSYLEMELERTKEHLALVKKELEINKKELEINKRVLEIREEALHATNAKNYTKASKLFIKLIDDKLDVPSDITNLNSHIYHQLIEFVSSTSTCSIEHKFFDEYSFKEVQTIIFSYEEAAKNVTRSVREEIQINEILNCLRPKITSCEKIIQELTKTCNTNLANFSFGAKRDSDSFINTLPTEIIDLILRTGLEWKENLVHLPISKIEKMASLKNAGLQ